MKSIDFGFGENKVELSLLYDADWEKKYQSGWLDRYSESRPDFITQKVIKERVGKAINTAGISSTEEMLSRLESLDPPKSFAVCATERQPALPLAENEPIVAPQRCADDRSNSELRECTCGYMFVRGS